jgi:hypothetical protein
LRDELMSLGVRDGPRKFILERVRSALAARDFTILAPVLAGDVQFASCVGRQQVIDYLCRKFGEGLQLELVEINSEVDKLVATIDLQLTKRDDPPFGAHRHFAILFVQDEKIVELQMARSREEALASARSPPPPARPGTLTVFSRLAPVLPVRDLAAALEHYARLGFHVRAYEGGGYGYAQRDGLSLHLNAFADLDPETTTSAIYLYVGDADLRRVAFGGRQWSVLRAARHCVRPSRGRAHRSRRKSLALRIAHRFAPWLIPRAISAFYCRASCCWGSSAQI